MYYSPIYIEWSSEIPGGSLIRKFIIYQKMTWEEKYYILGATSDNFFVISDTAEDADFRKVSNYHYKVVPLYYESPSVLSVSGGTFNIIPPDTIISPVPPLIDSFSVEIPPESTITFYNSFSKVSDKEEGIFLLIEFSEAVSADLTFKFELEKEGVTVFESNPIDTEVNSKIAGCIIDSTGNYTVKFSITNNNKTLAVNFKFRDINVFTLSDFMTGDISFLAVEPNVSNKFGGLIGRIIKETVRRNNVIYYDNFGEEFVLLSRKRAGERCPVCWDETLKQMLTGMCKVCYNTGYKGGYVQYRLKGQFQYPTEAYLYEPLEIAEWWTGRTMELLLSYFPPVKSRDIVVRADGTRWVVGRVNYTRISRAVLHQTATIFLVDTSQPIYYVPVEVNMEA